MDKNKLISVIEAINSFLFESDNEDHSNMNIFPRRDEISIQLIIRVWEGRNLNFQTQYPVPSNSNYLPGGYSQPIKSVFLGVFLSLGICGYRRGERERLFGSRERKLKITFPFYGKGTGIRKCYGTGREWEI